MDWKMPDMDGVATTRAIREIVGEDVPIIILSAYDWSDIEKEAVEAGVNAFIEKPLFKSRLTHVLKDVLGAETHLKKEKEELEAFCRQDHSGKRILLAEDNELNVEVATELLHMAGILVEPAANGQEALEKLQSHPAGHFELVFMDIQMPVMDGYETTRAIRRLPDKKLAKIPVIAMTANAFWEDRQKATEAGMDGYMSKPIEIPKLMELLDQMDEKR
jgi:CheY-like chemotaxis protein